MSNIWYIQVNRICNNQCLFCSNPSNENNISRDKGVEYIEELILRWYTWVVFTWWEPTLSPDLLYWIQYAKEKNIESRIISNWSITSDIGYVKWLKDSGLSLIHLSIYSHIPKVHDFLTWNQWSFKKLIASIWNCLKVWLDININTVINHYNQNHLDKLILFLTRNFPQIKHFIWNNLDPIMLQENELSRSTLPDFLIFENSLRKAVELLSSMQKTFRIERVPLCYMRGFEFASTETRKIVKDEERFVYFLDFREALRQSWRFWTNDKLPECELCSLNPICAWIYELKGNYSYVKAIPQALSDIEINAIIRKITDE